MHVTTVSSITLLGLSALSSARPTLPGLPNPFSRGSSSKDCGLISGLLRRCDDDEDDDSSKGQSFGGFPQFGAYGSGGPQGPSGPPPYQGGSSDPWSGFPPAGAAFGGQQGPQFPPKSSAPRPAQFSWWSGNKGSKEQQGPSYQLQQAGPQFPQQQQQGSAFWQQGGSLPPFPVAGQEQQQQQQPQQQGAQFQPQAGQFPQAGQLPQGADQGQMMPQMAENAGDMDSWCNRPDPSKRPAHCQGPALPPQHVHAQRKHRGSPVGR